MNQSSRSYPRNLSSTPSKLHAKRYTPRQDSSYPPTKLGWGFPHVVEERLEFAAPRRMTQLARLWQEQIERQSIGGDSENAGHVMFERSPGDRGTIVTVLQEFRMGKLAGAWETIVGRNPKQAVIENLRHFKALAETGEIPRTEGQPNGPRGTVAGAKKSLYGEKIPTPPGEDRKAG